MQKLTRNIGLTFRVTEAERDLIHKNMKAAGISNLRAYLLKMAVVYDNLKIVQKTCHSNLKLVH